MGKKRSNKHFKNNEGKNGSKRPKGDSWKCHTIPDDHPLFRQYYQKQLALPQEEFTQFWAAMKQKLPVVFRVNPNCPNHEAFCHKIEDEEFIKSIIPTEQIIEKKQNQGQAQHAENTLFEPKQMPKLQLINWYPGHIVYTMNTNKQTFKKSKIFSEFHKYLQKSFDSGLISRQELVSMLPPLYLNINSDDIVLDLCAAPGSKTSQILEMIYGQRRWLAKGCVIANDADYSRAQMLIHQLHRSGTTGMAVINHPGQFLPQLFNNKVGSVRQKFQFDKILCDVPCSGDGATRKLPIKWLSWHTSDGMVLHPLQLSILMKAINVLKKGGYIVYSTCSLNPIQNEAVISALFQKVAKGLELVDVHPMFGVKGRRGLLNWKVYSITDNYENIKQQQKAQKQQNIGKQQKIQEEKPKKERLLKQYANFEQVKNNKKVKPTMFAPTEQQAKRIHLDYTMRILPHDQNSGGFYVALLKKTHQFEWNYTTNQKKKIEEKGQAEVQQEFVDNNLPEVDLAIPQQPGEEDRQNEMQNKNEEESEEQENDENENEAKVEKKQEQEQEILEKQQKQLKQKVEDKKWGNKNDKKKQKGSKYETYNNINEEDFENLKKFYGIPDMFKNLLYIRSSQEGQNASKKVLLVSEGVRKFLDADTTKKIKLVNMGCQVFQKGKQSFAGNQCLYRLCQDGIHFILDYLQLRKIKVTLQFFKKAISIKTLSHDEIVDEATKQQMKATSQGSFCIYIDEMIDGKRVIDALVGQNFKNSFHLMVSKQDQASLCIRYLK